MSSNDLVARIKEIPVSQIIGAFYPLKRQGSDHVGVCPFHNDSDPSMRVSDKKELFKCFACGAGGDSIAFVQRYKNLEFKEALIEIAEKFSLPTDSLKSKREKNPKFDMAYKVLKAANKLFQKTAKENNPPPFLEFLNKREISEDTVSTFSIGYAPGNNILSNYLESLPLKDKDTAIKIALDIGMIRKSNKTDGYYDTFRDRVMFPIWDYSGNIVGFGGRAVFEYQKGKYINSQESFVFNKRNICYGLNLAKSHIRETKKVFLTEGYMDCIAMVKNSFPNSIAVMGVALSDRNAELISSMAEEIYFALDSDEAGIRASRRMNQQFMRLGKLPKQLNFGAFKDPDEYLSNKGSVELAELAEKSKTFVDWELDNLIPDSVPGNLDKRLAILNQAFELLSPIGKSLLATERLNEFAKKLGLKSTSDQIVDAYRDFLSSSKNMPPTMKQSKTNNMEALPQEPQPLKNGNQIAGKSIEKTLSKAERKVLKTIGEHPECFTIDNFRTLLENVTNNEVKRSFEIVENTFFETDEKEYPRLVTDMLQMQNIDLEIQEVITSGLFNYSGNELPKDLLKKLISGLEMNLKKERLVAKKQELIEEQKNCEDQNRSFEILKEINEVQKELNSLK